MEINTKQIFSLVVELGTILVEFVDLFLIIAFLLLLVRIKSYIHNNLEFILLVNLIFWVLILLISKALMPNQCDKFIDKTKLKPQKKYQSSSETFNHLIAKSLKDLIRFFNF